MESTDIRFRIAAARRMLYREGCDSTVAGHVSARADGEKRCRLIFGARPTTRGPTSSSSAARAKGRLAFCPRR